MKARLFSLIFLLLSFAGKSLRAGENPRIRFIPNAGQVRDTEGKPRPDIIFTAEFGGVSLFFMNDRVSYVFSRPNAEKEDYNDLYRMDWVFAKQGLPPGISVEGKLESTTRYYHPGVYSESLDEFSRLRYHNVNGKGTDLVFYSDENGLKYDWIFNDASRITSASFEYLGADQMQIEGDGSLSLTFPMGKLKDKAPVAFQNGRQLDCAFQLKNVCGLSQCISYTVPSAQAGQPLVVDPSVSWSTYYGGNNTEVDKIFVDIICDANRNVYWAGHSQSTNFPTSPGAFQTVYGGAANDAVIVKFDSSGNRQWATFMGGTAYDIAYGLVLDANNNLYFTGTTSSSDFPVTGGVFQQTTGGGQDAILVKFTSAGARVWATYMGGNDTDEGYRIVVHPSGDIILGGATISTNFPVSNGAWQTSSGGLHDAFLARFTNGGTRVWTTHIGGSLFDYCTGLGLDPAGDIMIAGYTQSTNFPVSNGAWQSVSGGGYDAFAGKFSASGQRVWLSYIGGSGSDDATAAAVDAQGSLYIGGKTTSSNFPVSAGALQGTYSAVSYMGMVAKFDNAGNRSWSSFFGGGQLDRILDMEIAANGLLLMTGETRGGASFPVSPGAMYPTLQGGVFDAFFTYLFPGGGLYYSSYYGSNGAEYGRAVGVAPNGYFALLGATASTTHPVTGGAFQSTFGGGSMDAFVTLFRDCGFVDPGLNRGDSSYVCTGNSITVTAQNSFPSYSWNTGASTNSVSAGTAGWYSVTVTDAAGCKGWDSTYLHVQPVPSATINPPGTQTGCSNTGAPLSAGTADYYQWYRNGVLIPGANAQMYYATNSGNYTVVLANQGGCSDSASTATTVNILPAPDVNFGNDTIICSGDTLFLDAGAGMSSYLWCDGYSGQNHFVLPGDTQCVRVTASNGCFDTDTIITTASQIQAAFSFIAGGGNAYTFTDQSGGSPLSWHWDFGDGNSSTQQNPLHTYSLSGTSVIVCLQVSGAGGCSSEICDTIQLAVGTVSAEEPALQIWPNPAESEIRIRGFSGTALLQVFDECGRIVYERNVTVNEPVSLSELSRGMYHLRLQTETHVQTGKLILR